MHWAKKSLIQLCWAVLGVVAVHAADRCELERVLGGEAAYRDCLVRQQGQAPNPVREQPVQPPAVVTPAPIIPRNAHPPMAIPVGYGGRELSPGELFEQVKASVFVVVGARNLTDWAREKLSQGSAVAVSTTRLLTNCHVVKDPKLLFLYQEEKVHKARLVWSDPQTDRCILAVDDLSLRPVTGIRSFISLKVGEKVFTVGAPYGLEHTLGEGLVSGKRSSDGVNIVQTSAPISPGSSGGGLFDRHGRLVGITTFLLKDAQSLNFAIAADEFTR